ncbi:MAG: SRPBCC domain-containing protein [Actinomycetota bacterium]
MRPAARWKGRHRVGPEGRLIRAEQVFLEIDRPRRIVYTETVIETGAPIYECVLTFTFEPLDGKTRMTLVHKGFPSTEEREKHERGTGIFLDRLESYMAKTKGAKE